jgi:hypothetical protein
MAADPSHVASEGRDGPGVPEAKEVERTHGGSIPLELGGKMPRAVVGSENVKLRPVEPFEEREENPLRSSHV